jgi:hypothetical protein
MVGELLLHAADGVELIIERGTLLHHALGTLGVAPEIGIFGLSIQLSEPRLGFVEVKDASSAVRSTA